MPGISSENAQRFRVVSIDDNNLSKQDIGNSPIEIFAKDNQIGIVNNSDESCIATVYDVTGKAITKVSVHQGATQLVGSSDNVTAGIYIVKVSGKTMNETKRVMVRK